MIRLLLAFLLVVMARAAEPIDAFPAPAEGLRRHVLELPPLENEDLAQVEIIVGKTVETDSVNRYFFGGRLAERNVEGYGYTYHVLESLGPMAGTLIAPPPEAKPVERFVTLGGPPFLVRYNSRLPLVIDVPADAEVRYRLWTTTADSEPVTPR